MDTWREIYQLLITERFRSSPAVALLGARQVGKSTLAEMIIEQFPDAMCLDMERPSDLNKLIDAEAFFQQFEGRMICLLTLFMVHHLKALLLKIY
ncbi:hypothetical protein MMIC_P0765 [Mariprofundus micogutta]|uniref:AAA domain-containing protein n=1 Tax=Mariprofundus micogutta TaxID=1921010 RepID=A0A1L8CLK7_9PROT|nr:AAA family ATPase [Mariprofundus micogutta]GAV19807.1 hypothetical protein MMIC_P0765 [Mariprofundus micogutta]